MFNSLSNTTFNENSHIITKIGTTVIIIILFAIIYSFFDHSHWKGIEEHDDVGYKKLFNRLYYSTVSWSTVGFGDISPNSVITRSLFMSQIIILLIIAFVW